MGVAIRLRRRSESRLGNEQLPLTPADVELPRSGARKLLLLIPLLLLVAGLLAVGYDNISASNYFPSTTIGGVAVGSLTVDEATSKLQREYIDALKTPITLKAPQFEEKISPWDMGMRLDAGKVASAVHTRQQEAAVYERLWRRAAGDNSTYEVRPKLDERVFDDFLGETFKSLDRDAKDARLELFEGNKLRVIPHEVGRDVDRKKAEQRIFDAIHSGEKVVDLPVKTVMPALTKASFDKVIVVSTSANTLKLYNKGKLTKQYGVATGTGGYPTPHGQFRITLKRMNPTWVNPNSDWSKGMPPYIGPGPNNPLGTRALNLNASGIRIHGSPEAGSIGTNASHGCIRMLIPQSEELFEKVDVGTPVLIV